MTTPSVAVFLAAGKVDPQVPALRVGSGHPGFVPSGWSGCVPMAGVRPQLQGCGAPVLQRVSEDQLAFGPLEL